MEVRFLPVDGAASRPEDLTIAKARDLALRLAAGEIPHAALVECRGSDGAEAVVLDVRVEVPNQRRYPILRNETISATFYECDDRVPKVEALRNDFPIVPHLNLHLQEYPRWLCLYDERYEELKRKWTAARFVQRIREWLELTARGELHQDDQRLEPLLVDYSGHIVLPPDLATNTPEQLYVTGVALGGPRAFLLTHRQPPADADSTPPILVSIHRCEPRTHGVIHRRPTTLADVAELSEAAGLSLIDEIRRSLPIWKEQALDSRVILLLLFPKTRVEAGQVEDYGPWCFGVGHTVRQLGIALGFWDEVDGELATLLEKPTENRGESVPIEVLNPCFALTRDAAARLNGRDGANDAKILAVGVGALGSQVVMNLARSGFGRWTLIDPDSLMPHNIARHALDGRFVGFNKAETVAYAAGITTFEDEMFVGLDADVLLPRARTEDVEAAFQSADVVVDMTASLATQRHLALDAASPARRVSAFLDPSGADLVVLAEDPGRQVRLDSLEMQYYRALLSEPELAGHLDAQGVPQRYARSCGDTTSAIPHDYVALHAAIASRAVKDVLSDNSPFIGLWRCDTSCSVRRVLVPVRDMLELEVDSWRVVLDDGLRERLSHNRASRLPNETGGVLLGSFDLEREIVYIVDTLPSPPDSEERRDLYIRGCKGLHEAVADVQARTGGMLEYVGEWHSHPHGSSTRPSEYDLAAFGWLTTLMSRDGLPAVMMIVGGADETSLFVGSMGREARPIPGCNHGQVVA